MPKMPMMRALFLLAVGCSEYNVGNGADAAGAGFPDIVVDPTAVDFGANSDPTTRSVRILNRGTAELDVSGVRVEPAGAFALPDPNVTHQVPPGGSTTQDIVWTPTTDLDVASLVVSSDDPDTPELEVPLSGKGLFGELTIEPDPLVFEAITSTCELTWPVTLRNTGDAPLTLNGVSVTGTSFTVADVYVPVDIGVEETLLVDVTFAPVTGDAAFSGVLSVDSSDRRGTRTAGLEGASIARVHHTDVFEQAEGLRIDMLFFVDTSGSMDDDAANLAANFDAFLDGLLDKGTDYQIIVVTKDNGCHNETIVTPDTPDPEGVFTIAVSVLGGVYLESGLTVASAALAQTGPGFCNEGFVRVGVPTITVMLSDEPEQSSDPWDTYVEIMNYFSPGVVINGVVGQPNSPCAENGTGYHEAIDATGGVDYEICDVDWGQRVADILGTAGLSSSFPLSVLPDPLTIAVEVDGAPVTTGWLYVPASNVILFDVGHVPASGSTIEIEYDEPAACPD